MKNGIQCITVKKPLFLVFFISILSVAVWGGGSHDSIKTTYTSEHISKYYLPLFDSPPSFFNEAIINLNTQYESWGIPVFELWVGSNTHTPIIETSDGSQYVIYTRDNAGLVLFGRSKADIVASYNDSFPEKQISISINLHGCFQLHLGDYKDNFGKKTDIYGKDLNIAVRTSFPAGSFCDMYFTSDSNFSSSYGGWMTGGYENKPSYRKLIRYTFDRVVDNTPPSVLGWLDEIIITEKTPVSNGYYLFPFSVDDEANGVKGVGLTDFPFSGVTWTGVNDGIQVVYDGGSVTKKYFILKVDANLPEGTRCQGRLSVRDRLANETQMPVCLVVVDKAPPSIERLSLVDDNVLSFACRDAAGIKDVRVSENINGSEVANPLLLPEPEEGASETERRYTLDLAPFLVHANAGKTNKKITVAVGDLGGHETTADFVFSFPPLASKIAIQFASGGSIEWNQSAGKYESVLRVPVASFFSETDTGLFGPFGLRVTRVMKRQDGSVSETQLPDIDIQDTAKVAGFVDVVDSMGMEAAHAVVSYRISLLWRGVAWGAFDCSAVSNAQVMNVPFSATVSMLNGDGETVASLAKDGTDVRIVYCTNRETGSAYAVSATRLVIPSVADTAEGDVVSWKASLLGSGGSAVETATLSAGSSLTVLSLCDALGISLSGTKVVADISLSYEEKSGSVVVASGTYDPVRLVVDNAPPSVTKIGRRSQDGAIANHTADADFTFSVTAADAETGLSECLIWANATGAALPTNVVEVSPSRAQIEEGVARIDLTEAERQKIVQGWGLHLTLPAGQIVSSRFDVGWRLPPIDGNYTFFAYAWDGARNKSVTPGKTIVLSKLLQDGEIGVAFDPNAADVLTAAWDAAIGSSAVESTFILPLCILCPEATRTGLGLDLSAAEVRISVTDPSGKASNPAAYSIVASGGSSPAVSFTVKKPIGGALYGTYALTVGIEVAGTKPAGIVLESETGKNIRVNRPYSIALRDFPITAGTAVALTCGTLEDSFAILGDDENPPDAVDSIEWEVLRDSTVIDTRGNGQEYTFTKDPSSQTASFILRVTARDVYGSLSRTSATVTVTNTEAGTLAADETWSGVHYLRGSVTVPAGRVLTIEAGTKVIAVTSAPASVAASDIRVEVSSGGVLRVQGSAADPVSFDADTETRWGGIRCLGTATLIGAEFEKAVQAVSFGSSAAGCTVSGCVFARNLVGIALRGCAKASVTIMDTNFSRNDAYAIKEDERGKATLSADLSFDGNANDYYDSETGTVLSWAEDAAQIRAGDKE